MQNLISCDWGTSALRLRLVDTDKMSVLAETFSEQGISATFDLWKHSGRGENERFSFYQSLLAEEIKKLEGQLNFSIEGAPLIVSGMASSSMGMMELPYKDAPFSTDGHDLEIKIIEPANDFKHTILIISGVKSANDAMRGEETQLIGCLNKEDQEDKFFIFPGTHSKHVRIKDAKMADFKTYMTGEFFELLSAKSILSNVVEKKLSLSDGNNLKSFENGAAAGLQSNLLHSSFLVRTNYLLDKLSKEENYWYLSGLLIGTELKELIAIKIPLTVVSDGLLAKLYSIALGKLGIHKVKCRDAGKALADGHCRIYNLYKPEFNTGRIL
jgi:2-dehydro-3-deoxygalactonokinase